MSGRKQRKELTDEERLALFHDLLAISRDFVLPRGEMKKKADLYGVSLNTVKRVWQVQSTGVRGTNLVLALRKIRKNKPSKQTSNVA